MTLDADGMNGQRTIRMIPGDAQRPYAECRWRAFG
jgi:hypothetical protein